MKFIEPVTKAILFSAVLMSVQVARAEQGSNTCVTNAMADGAVLSAALELCGAVIVDRDANLQNVAANDEDKRPKYKRMDQMPIS